MKNWIHHSFFTRLQKLFKEENYSRKYDLRFLRISIFVIYRWNNQIGSSKTDWIKKSRTTDTQWRHKSKISLKLGQCDIQNMLRPYLKIWDWIFGRAALGVCSPCYELLEKLKRTYILITFWPCLHLKLFMFCSRNFLPSPTFFLKSRNFGCTYNLRSCFWMEKRLILNFDSLFHFY